MKTGLFVIPVDASGGAEKLVAMLAVAMDSMPGWRVELMVLANQNFKFYAPELPESIHVTYGKGSGRAGSEIRLITRLLAKRFDFVFSTHLRLNVFLSVARRLGLLRCTRLVTRESTVISDRYSGFTAILYRFGHLLYGGQDTILVQTRYMAEKLCSRLPVNVSGRVLIAQNPIDVENIKKMSSPQSGEDAHDRVVHGEKIVWCGRLIDVKAPLVALEVLSKLHSKGSKAELFFVGDGPLEKSARDYAAVLGISDSVFFLGHLKNPYPVFAASNYGLITSLSEGFPNVLLEMLASGVKCVFATPCAGDLGKLPGVVVAPGFSADDLASKILVNTNSGTEENQEVISMLSSRAPLEYLNTILGDSLVGDDV